MRVVSVVPIRGISLEGVTTRRVSGRAADDALRGSRNTYPLDMATGAEIAWNGRRAVVDLARAALHDTAGRVVLQAAGDGGWRVLDRSPVSVRLARADGAVCRFEMMDDGLKAEIVGGVWLGRVTGREAAEVMLDAEVRDGDVAAQDRTR